MTLTRGSPICKPTGIHQSMTSLTEKEAARPGGPGARTRILNAASERFYFEGINAKSVGRIGSKESVSKQTLYQHFPRKSALVEEYLRRLRQEACAAERSPSGTPRAQLLGQFDIAEWRRRTEAGGPSHNTAVEAGGMPAVERIVDLHKHDYVDGLVHLAWPRGGPVDAGRRCSTRVHPHCRPRSTIRPPGRVPARRPRPSVRRGRRCQNRVVDRGRRDRDDGFLGATDDI